MRGWLTLALLIGAVMAGCTAQEPTLAAPPPPPAAVAESPPPTPSPTRSPTPSAPSPSPSPSPTATPSPGPSPTATPAPPAPPDAPAGPVAPQWGPESAPLRPGAPIGWCTFNFLFYEVVDDEVAYYVGTAAHCVDEVGQRIPLRGHGEVGTVVYDSDTTPGADAGVDFALIRLDDGMNLRAHPRMFGSDGPVGEVGPGETQLGDLLHHHGYGLVWGDTPLTRDRAGVLLHHGKDYCAESPVWWGDSGSPVLHADTQKALGIVSRAGWIWCLPYAGAQVMGASMPYIHEELRRAGFHVSLATV